MRKKWEIEDEYRKFCRNNKELALQTLRELTLTPTETGKEDQRIAYCMEWMKQQGMESVHTDELGNVIWEYRPEQEKKVLYTAHLDTVFSLEEPLEIKEDGMIWRCPGITDDTVNVVMLLMAAKYVHETEPELPCGLRKWTPYSHPCTSKESTFRTSTAERRRMLTQHFRQKSKRQTMHSASAHGNWQNAFRIPQRIWLQQKSS